MTPVVVLALALFSAGGGPAAHQAQASDPCRSPRLQEVFLAYIAPSGGSELGQPGAALRPFLPDALRCLKQWVEDGGVRDQLPLRYWGPDPQKIHDPSGTEVRTSYRLGALGLLGDVGQSDPSLSAWIRERMVAWPEPVQRAALATLGTLKDQESVPLLSREARNASGVRRSVAWSALARCASRQAVATLVPLAETTGEFALLGDTMLRVNDLVVIPVLEELVERDPERKDAYRARIRELQAEAASPPKNVP